MGEIYASFAFIFVLFGTNVDPRYDHLQNTTAVFLSPTATLQLNGMK